MDRSPLEPNEKGTKTLTLDGCANLMKRGRFLEALEILRQLQISPRVQTYPHFQSLLADALQRTGRNHEASIVTTQLTRTTGVSASTLARCHFILGNIAKDRGQPSQAAAYFRKALANADAGKEVELACWAQLRLVAATADLGGIQAAMAFLSETRQRLTRFGEIRPFVALHLWIAEAESKSGFLGNARRHLRIARSLLDQVDDVWLKTYFAINSFCVSYYSAEIHEAHNWARAAAEYSAISGHAPSKRAAYSSLGHVEFSLGHLREAERYFRLALECCENGSASQVAVLDSIAQVKLYENELPGAQAILSELEHVLSSSNAPKPSYYEEWALQTRLQLMLKQGRLKEAKILSERIGSSLFSDPHSRLATVLKLLAVEALLANREPDTATRMLHLFLRDSIDYPPDLLAERERVIARTLALSGCRDAASIHFDRAIRTFEALGHVVGKSTVLAEPAPCLSRQDPAAGYDSIRRTVDRILALLETVRRPELAGHEAFNLLHEMECSNHLALTAAQGSDNVEVLASSDSSSSKGIAQVRSEELEITIELGFSRGRRFELSMLSKPDLSSRMACLGTKKIVAAFLEAEVMRQDLTESAALWPADDRALNDEAIIASESMMAIIKTVKRVAPTVLTILLTGETGTGKEVLAQAVHRYSDRSLKPFIAFNCAAVPRDLIESQLFGYRRGAFSGAVESFAGVIRSANGGTLFLDEIGEIGLEIQPKLLRFVESGEVQGLGESQPTKTDVRLVFATNADLDLAVQQRRFREDLFFRMNVIRLNVPPLRERREEISLLVQHFIKRVSKELYKPCPRVTSEAMEHLILFSWPGNIRQLANEVRRFVALVDENGVITPDRLSPAIIGRKPATWPGEPSPSEVAVRLDQTLTQATEQLERRMLTHALKAADGRVTVAARSLGLSRKGLYLKRRRLGLCR